MWAVVTGTVDPESSDSDEPPRSGRNRQLLAAALLAGAACVAAAGSAAAPRSGVGLRKETGAKVSKVSGLYELGCAGRQGDCTSSRCCSDADMACYAKDHNYAVCWDSCKPGVHEADPPEYRTPWSCEVLGPTASPAAPAPAPNLTPGGCLCLFDIDRTLTSKQSESCGHAVGGGVTDTAFGGGLMRLSEVGNDLSATACGGCRKGIISAGAADGRGEQQVLAARLGVSEPFSPAGAVASPLVFGCGNGEKQNCASDILGWFASAHGIRIEPGDVYFFDDLAQNIGGFARLGMNAHQISCAGRDGDIGRCGATVREVALGKGVTYCSS